MVIFGGDRVLIEPFSVIKGVALGNRLLLGHPACRRHKISLHADVNGITVGIPGAFLPYEDVIRTEDMEIIEKGDVFGGAIGDNTGVMVIGNIKTHTDDTWNNCGDAMRDIGVHGGNNFSECDNGIMGGDTDTNIDIITDTNNVVDVMRTKGVLSEDVVLMPGSKTYDKSQVEGSEKTCVIEGSEKLRGIISTASVNSVSNTGVTWLELLNCNDTVRKYQRNTYVLD